MSLTLAKAAFYATLVGLVTAVLGVVFSGTLDPVSAGALVAAGFLLGAAEEGGRG